MYIYLAVFIMMSFYGKLIFNKGISKNYKIIFLTFNLIIFGTIECLREFTIGEDTINYINWFIDYSKAGWTNSLYHPTRDVEIGYKVLNLLIAEFTQNPRILLVIVSILILGLHLWFLNVNSKNVWLSMVLFVGLNFFTNSMTAWRQYIAMGIVVWLYPLLLKKEYKKAMVVVLTGALFHKTSIICSMILIIMYFFSYTYKNILRISMLLLLCIPVIEVIVQCILKYLPKYRFYFSQEELGNMAIGKLRWLFIIIEIAMIIYVYANKRYHSRKIVLLSLMVIFSVYVGILGKYIPHIFRLGYYFDYFLLLFIPEIIPSTGTNKAVAEITVWGMSLLFYYYYLITNAGGIVPYHIYLI